MRKMLPFCLRDSKSTDKMGVTIIVTLILDSSLQARGVEVEARPSLVREKKGRNSDLGYDLHM